MQIELKNLCFGYKDEFCLKDISLQISQGESIAIMGLNGSGKTTLLNLLAGLIKPSFGEVLSDGMSIHKDKKAIREYWAKIGYLLQLSERMVFSSTVKKEIEYSLKARNFKKDIRQDLISKAINLAGIDSKHMERHPMTLSGGELRKVEIASVLSYNPELILFDEPLAGLDLDSRMNFYRLLDEIKGKCSVVMVTHDASSALRMNRLIVLENGRIKYDGDSSIILNNNICCEIGIEINELTSINAILKARGVDYEDSLREVLNEI